jgi:hypothetical protein
MVSASYKRNQTPYLFNIFLYPNTALLRYYLMPQTSIVTEVDLGELDTLDSMILLICMYFSIIRCASYKTILSRP